MKVSKEFFNMSKKVFVNKIEIDEEKVRLLLRKIIIKEKRNIKTKEKSQAEMVKQIKKMIEEEVECYLEN